MLKNYIKIAWKVLLRRKFFTFISLFAITNTALLNYIMGSRLLYGMADQGLVPRFLGAVHRARRTPHHAILVMIAVALCLALPSSLASLARATAVLLLCVFMVVNASLLVLQRRAGEPRGFEISPLIPAAGILVCGALLVHAKRTELLTAGILLAGIVILHLVMRGSGRSASRQPEG